MTTECAGFMVNEILILKKNVTILIVLMMMMMIVIGAGDQETCLSHTTSDLAGWLTSLGVISQLPFRYVILYRQLLYKPRVGGSLAAAAICCLIWQRIQVGIIKCRLFGGLQKVSSRARGYDRLQEER